MRFPGGWALLQLAPGCWGVGTCEAQGAAGLGTSLPPLLEKYRTSLGWEVLRQEAGGRKGEGLVCGGPEEQAAGSGDRTQHTAHTPCQARRERKRGRKEGRGRKEEPPGTLALGAPLGAAPLLLGAPPPSQV